MINEGNPQMNLKKFLFFIKSPKDLYMIAQGNAPEGLATACKNFVLKFF